MENRTILNSETDKYILLNFDNIFKPSDTFESIQNTILKEKEKVINPIIDVEMIRYKIENVIAINPQFVSKTNIYSNSLIP